VEYQMFLNQGESVVHVPPGPRIMARSTDPPGTFWVNGNQVQLPLDAEPTSWTPIPETGGWEARLKNVKPDPDRWWDQWNMELWVRTPPS